MRLPSARCTVLWWIIALLLAINAHTFLWWHQHDQQHHIPLPPAEVICPLPPACPDCMCPVCPEPAHENRTRSKPEEPEMRDSRAVWYFHHMPKCAGTAVTNAMRAATRSRRFATVVVRDDGIKGPRYGRRPLKQPTPGSVLAGHWPAKAPWVRYPDLLSDPEHHKLFTVVRDPWSTRVSLYWYHRKWKHIPQDTDIVRFMLSDPETMRRIRRHGNGRPHRNWYAQEPLVVNYLPFYFKCRNETHCGKVLEIYSYVGAVGIEGAPNPLLPLAVLKNGDRKTAPPKLRRANPRPTAAAAKGLDYRKEMGRIEKDPEVRRRFRELNALDYWVYDECVRRYRQDWQRLVVVEGHRA